MPTQEYALDEQVKVWVEVALPELQGLPNEVSFRKDLSEGANGSPQAYLQTLPAGYKVRPHFHTEAQFQVVLEGSISFPAHDLGAIAVHYSDRHTAYGPFVAGPDFKFAVVRPRKAGKDFMEDRQARQRRDPYGRELFGSSADLPWEPVPGSEQVTEAKVLFATDGRQGPAAQLWKCSSNSSLVGRAAPFGEYQILVEGSAHLAGREVKRYFMRYVVGDSPAPLICGPQGATWLILTFDQAAQGPVD